MNQRTATCAVCGGPRHVNATLSCQACRVYPTRPAIDRITDRITIDTHGCWLWPGSKTPGGYGQIRADGRCQVTHRVTFAHFVGPIPPGLELDHLCRVRHCCNPDHLEPVTRLENVHRGLAVLPRKIRPCSICGESFTGRPWAATCSAACRSEAGRRAAYRRWSA